jgi:hypothetical protein
LAHQDAVNPDGSDKQQKRQGKPYSDGIVVMTVLLDKVANFFTALFAQENLHGYG